MVLPLAGNLWGQDNSKQTLEYPKNTLEHKIQHNIAKYMYVTCVVRP